MLTMGLKNVTVNSQHGVERLFIRATSAQKELIKELREEKKKFIRNEDGVFYLYNDSELVRALNKETVEKLLEQEFFVYTDSHSNKIILNTIAR